MKTKILTILLLASSLTLSQESFLKTKDFKLHYSAGAVSGALISQISDTFELDINPWVTHIGSALFVGFTKEIIDANSKNNHFSVNDLSYTILGGVSSLALEELLNLIGVEKKYTRASVISVGLTTISLNLKF